MGWFGDRWRPEPQVINRSKVAEHRAAGGRLVDLSMVAAGKKEADNSVMRVVCWRLMADKDGDLLVLVGLAGLALCAREMGNMGSLWIFYLDYNLGIYYVLSLVRFGIFSSQDRDVRRRGDSGKGYVELTMRKDRDPQIKADILDGLALSFVDGERECELKRELATLEAEVQIVEGL